MISVFIFLASSLILALNFFSIQEGSNEPYYMHEADKAPSMINSNIKSEAPPLEQNVHKLNNIKVRGVYLSGISAGKDSTLNNIIDLSKKTELNTVVIDIKDDYGKVDYATKIDEVIKLGAFNKLYDAAAVIKKLHDNNIYVIGRIVTFKDPILGEKRPDLAIKRANGQVYIENKTQWVDPYKQEVWKYNIDIAKEAVNNGFDEIQFDYVRFPAVNAHKLKFENDVGSKADAINNFLDSAYDELHNKMGENVSANIFGIVCETSGDHEGIGQDIERIGKNINYISPMLYPSHFANKAQNGIGQVINGVKFTAPDLMAYKVVYNSLIKAKKRISRVKGYKASIRPYLQCFTASWLAKGYYKKYTPYDVKEQIKAVYAAGYQEWILWNAANIYNKNDFEKRQ